MKELIAVLLVGLVFLSGCIENKSNDYETMGIKDCVNDASCYEQSMEQCEVAKMRTNETMHGITLSVYSEVKGGTVEACKVYFRITDIILSEDASIEEKASAMIMKDKDMTCTGPVNQVKVFDLESDMCEGSLIDLMKTGKEALN